MRAEGHVTVKPATPQYVLAVLVDQHRQQCQYDPEADPDASLSFEMTVEEWRDACDLLDWQPLARALDDDWRLGYSDSEWHDVLEPARHRKLRDLCQFIADRATAAEVRPARIMGKDCLSAGAFFAICSRLRQAGVDVSGISPSTLLAPFARNHAEVFLGAISKLAPNVLPKVKIEHLWYDRWLACFELSLLLGSISFVVSRWINEFLLLGAASVATGLISYMGVRNTSKRHPKSVEFGNLKTFRDLAKLIASGNSASA